MARRFGWCVVGALLALAVGCKSKADGSDGGDGDGGAGGDGDGDGTVNIETVSGERLEARFLSGGGAEWFESVYDTEFDAPCGFGVGADGGLYCFPGNAPGTAYVNVVFVDEDCEELIGRSWDDVCTEVATFATLEEPGDCSPRGFTLYEVGDEIDLPETIYERDYQGNCVEGTSMGRTFELTEVPLDELVPITTEVVERSNELGVQMYVSEDGLRLPRNPYDLSRQMPCGFQTIGGPESQANLCLGLIAYTDAGGHYGYADSACEVNVAATTQCAEPAYIVGYYQVDECYHTELFGLGSEVDATDLYRAAGDSCEPMEDSYYHQFFELGEALSYDDVPQLARNHEGTTRLVVEVYENAGSTVMPTTNIWDTELEAYCYPQSIAGTTYCVPNNTHSLNPTPTRFADDACTIQLEYYTESPCYEYTVSMVSRWTGDSACGSQELEAIFDVEYYEGDVVYVLNGEDCVEEPAEENVIYFMAGEELDPDEILVEITRKG